MADTKPEPPFDLRALGDGELIREQSDAHTCHWPIATREGVMTAPTDEQEKALQELADQAQELGMGYEPPIDPCRAALAELVRVQTQMDTGNLRDTLLYRQLLKEHQRAMAAARAALEGGE